MDKHSVLQDDFDFLLKFISHPRQIGSIVPSSQYLTDAMLRRVPWDSVHSLVELGAGTGVITCEINRRAPMNCKLISVEQDADMRSYLETIYPRFTFAAQAEDLPHILQQQHLENADCIVSALPFLSFSAPQRELLIKRIKDALAPNGVFILFQYSPLLRTLLRKHFSSIETTYVLRNLPPAFVFTCRK